MQIAVIRTGFGQERLSSSRHGIDESGQAVLKRKLRRSEVLPLFAGLAPALVGIEACHTAHYWGREIAALGHDVRLMPPQFVKPYVEPEERRRRRRGDRRSPAVQRPTMRFVPIKSADQQAVLMPAPDARLTDPPAERRLIRAPFAPMFAEFGIVVGQGIRNVERLLALLETAGDQRLPALAAGSARHFGRAAAATSPNRSRKSR